MGELGFIEQINPGYHSPILIRRVSPIPDLIVKVSPYRRPSARPDEIAFEPEGSSAPRPLREPRNVSAVGWAWNLPTQCRPRKLNETLPEVMICAGIIS